MKSRRKQAKKLKKEWGRKRPAAVDETFVLK